MDSSAYWAIAVIVIIFVLSYIGTKMVAAEMDNKCFEYTVVDAYKWGIYGQWVILRRRRLLWWTWWVPYKGYSNKEDAEATCIKLRGKLHS